MGRVIQNDMSKSENELPDELRGKIFSRIQKMKDSAARYPIVRSRMYALWAFLFIFIPVAIMTTSIFPEVEYWETYDPIYTSVMIGIIIFQIYSIYLFFKYLFKFIVRQFIVTSAIVFPVNPISSNAILWSNSLEEPYMIALYSISYALYVLSFLILANRHIFKNAVPSIHIDFSLMIVTLGSTVLHVLGLVFHVIT